MIYIVVPVEDDGKDALEDAIQSSELPIYKDYAPNVFLVNFQGTSRELCKILGIGEEDSGFMTGVVVPFSGYYGFAASDFWQWIKANG